MVYKAGSNAVFIPQDKKERSGLISPIVLPFLGASWAFQGGESRKELPGDLIFGLKHLVFWVFNLIFWDTMATPPARGNDECHHRCSKGFELLPLEFTGLLIVRTIHANT